MIATGAEDSLWLEMMQEVLGGGEYIHTEYIHSEYTHTQNTQNIYIIHTQNTHTQNTQNMYTLQLQPSPNSPPCKRLYQRLGTSCSQNKFAKGKN